MYDSKVHMMTHFPGLKDDYFSFQEQGEEFYFSPSTYLAAKMLSIFSFVAEIRLVIGLIVVIIEGSKCLPGRGAGGRQISAHVVVRRRSTIITANRYLQILNYQLNACVDFVMFGKICYTVSMRRFLGFFFGLSLTKTINIYKCFWPPFTSLLICFFVIFILNI